MRRPVSRGIRYAPNNRRARGAMERRPAVKKSSTVAKNGNDIFKEHKLTIGLDLGDRSTHYCILNEAGEAILEHSLPTTPKAYTKHSMESHAVESHWNEGGRNPDRVDVRPDGGRPASAPAEPRRGMFSGVATWTQELRPESATAAHQQGGRPLSEDHDGAGRTLHPGTLWGRQ
jgi:hypothetical protein